MRRPAEKRIEKFLSDYPHRKSRVVVGYASAYGLSSLAEHARSREVDLFIGNHGDKTFRNGSLENIEAAIKFLERTDVNLRSSRYVKNHTISSVHMKSWHTQNSNNEHKILAGSANLTKRGLSHNTECMGEYHGIEANDVMWSMNGVWCGGQDIKPKILECLSVMKSASLADSINN